MRTTRLGPLLALIGATVFGLGACGSSGGNGHAHATTTTAPVSTTRTTTTTTTTSGNSTRPLPTTTSAGATLTGGLGRFLGTWQAHGAYLTIGNDGGGTLSFRSYTGDPATDQQKAALHILGVTGVTARVVIDSSTDPADVTTGATTLTFDPAHDTLTFGAPVGMTLCGPQATLGYCGA